MTVNLDPEARPGAPRLGPATLADAWDPPRWASPVLMGLSAVGVGIAAYLTVAHYATRAILACPDTGGINCEKVTSSPQSVVFGIPVALIGLAYFVALAVLNLPVCWRSRGPLLRWGRIGLATSGIAFAVYLIYTELLIVHAVCLWCTGAHIVAFLAFVAVLSADGLARPAAAGPTLPDATSGCLVAPQLLRRHPRTSPPWQG
jgi:uncharacterized membrane protein